MLSERIEGTLRVLTGVVTSLMGRLVGDGGLAARGDVRRLSGEAALACVRVRARRTY